MYLALAALGLIIAPTFYLTKLDSEEKTDPDIVRHPVAGRHEAETIKLRRRVPIERISVFDRYECMENMSAAGG